MSDQPKVENSWMATPFNQQKFSEAWQMPMKVFLEERTQMLEESRKITAAWVKRRQEALETGMQAFGAMATCRDPGALASIYSGWFKGSMDRLTADMNDIRDGCARLAEIRQKSMSTLLRQNEEIRVGKSEPSASGREPERTSDATRGRSAAE